jgi:uncharacterized membrane protein
MKNLLLTTTILIAFGFSGAAFAANTAAKNSENNAYVEQAITKLPAKDAAQFRDTMKQAHEKNMAIYDQVHSIHDDMEAILVAESFDKDAFRAKSKQLQDVYDTMRANMDDAFVSAVAKLSQDERKTIATAMAYPHTKHASKDMSKTQ